MEIINNNKNMDIVNQFQYLGSIVTHNNNINVEINRRITMGNRCCYGLQSLLRSKLIKYMKPVVLYGSRSCALTRVHVNEDKLKIF
jgi:hypothetical protein